MTRIRLLVLYSASLKCFVVKNVDCLRNGFLYFKCKIRILDELKLNYDFLIKFFTDILQLFKSARIFSICIAD